MGSWTGTDNDGNQSRTLSYNATPPAGTTGTWSFAGTLSIDGSSEPICGDSQLDSATFHPADLSDNWRMEINEVTAYGAAWKTGATWPRPPNPIPIDYVTNAGFLWKVGEVYHYDPSEDPPWVPGTAFQAAPTGGQRAGGSRTSGTVVSSFDPSSYTPGIGVGVTISVTPDPSVEVYAVEDGPPTGWAVSEISDGGSFDTVNNLVKWGPFFDNQVRNLVYTATPPAEATGPHTFAGQASFDGTSVPITGDRTIQQDGGCTTNEQCDDGIYCNGVETCDVASGTCQAGSNPCDPPLACHETSDMCLDAEVFADGFESGDTSAWSSTAP